MPEPTTPGTVEALSKELRHPDAYLTIQITMQRGLGLQVKRGTHRVGPLLLTTTGQSLGELAQILIDRADVDPAANRDVDQASMVDYADRVAALNETQRLDLMSLLMAHVYVGDPDKLDRLVTTAASRQGPSADEPQ